MERTYYEGDFVNAQAEGKGIYVQSNGCTYIGDWKKDQQDGLGKEIWPKRFEYGKWFGKINFVRWKLL